MPIAKTDLERRMFNVLRRISRQYWTAESLLKHGDCGLEGAEALEMAYENIQAEAKAAIKGVRLAPPSRHDLASQVAKLGIDSLLPPNA